MYWSAVFLIVAAVAAPFALGAAPTGASGAAQALSLIFLALSVAAIALRLVRGSQ